MKYNVRLFENGIVTEDKVDSGTNLLEYLQSKSINIESPCGGKGTCGKCRVKLGGSEPEPTKHEITILGKKLVNEGYRLACHHIIEKDLDIYLHKVNEEANIVTEGKEKRIKTDPIITKVYAELEKPDINDQRSDLDRIASYSDMLKEAIPLKAIKTLPKILRKSDFKVTLLVEDNKIIAVEPGNTTDILYGIAIDIGTTTIAAYLYDLNSGERLGVYSQLNPQKKYGADVLTRIQYASSSEEAKDEICRIIVECINDIIVKLTDVHNMSKNSIYLVSIVGNTTMMHLFMNIPAENIAIAPFIPATTSLHKVKACEVGLDINENGICLILPSVSGYIGGDIVAGVLSTDMHLKKEISLLIDIGTNGEMVLGNCDFLYSCSTAAGPAFEGANIRNGLGGVKGAIDKVRLVDQIEYTTIGNEKPIGICGSGVIDAVGEMLKKGIIDETGRIIDDDEATGLSDYFRQRIVDLDGIRGFLIEGNFSNISQNDIVITQKDIREIQNAKAAIAAGIISLIKHSNIQMKDIDKVYLAGGFGNYINTSSAITIGLIPEELKGKIESIGNSAGAGAIECLLSKERLQEANDLKERIEYIELSASPEFTDQYVENMFFKKDFE
ncbi:MAG TPA: DUF4445 domain-containing protein [Clostridiaceae bacterium]|nr:DUF4445 domain-containing protein [Clostridiaceae bacterium]